MSHTLARALAAFDRTVAGVRGGRHARKTIDYLIEELSRSEAMVVQTRRGDIKFLTARSRHVAEIATHFHDTEPETLEWIDQNVGPDQVLWDIGAAVGAYTLYAARGGARVVSIEPKALSFAVMFEHVALNGLLDRVTPLCAAMSDKVALTTINYDEITAGAAMNALAGSVTIRGEAPTTYSQGLLALSMDGLRDLFGAPQPDHVKLDVDGVEGWILAGGPKTLAKVKTLLVEVEGDNVERAAELIDAPLNAAGLFEDLAMRSKGQGRNRLFVRA